MQSGVEGDAVEDAYCQRTFGAVVWEERGGELPEKDEGRRFIISCQLKLST
jgi:hypothetical protein